VKPFELLGRALAFDGTEMKLTRRGDEYLILADDAVLMNSRMHGSEEALATSALQRARTARQPCVLIGGLGMGFTLRATLDLLSDDATVVVAELVPAVVEWNRGPLGPLAGNPLNDGRVQVDVRDVGAVIASSHDRFDAMLLDVDNGPAAFTTSYNNGLYNKDGLAAAYAALKPGGVLAIWATTEDRKFAQRLHDASFEANVQHPRARLKCGGSHHTIFLGRKC